MLEKIAKEKYILCSNELLIYQWTFPEFSQFQEDINLFYSYLYIYV